MATLDLDGMNVTLPDGTVFTTPYLTGSNNVTNSGLLDATLTEGGGPAGNTYSGTITDGTHATTAITQTSGEVTFRGSSTYSGGTNLDGGIIGITSARALGTGTLTMAGGTLRAAAGNISFSNAIDFAGAGTIDDNGYNLVVNDSFAGAGPLTITGSGQVTLELTNPNAYSGDVFFNSGTLTFVGGLPFNVPTPSESIGTGTLHLATGATLNLPGGSQLVTPVKLTSNIELDGAATVTSTYNSFYNGAAPSIFGAISGSGSLTIDGPLELDGNNTYTGGTVIDAAVLVGGSIVGNVTDDGTLTFYNLGTNFSGRISGNGAVVVGQTLTLSGASSYSGGTTIDALLLVANNLALGTGSIGFNGGILQSGAPNIALANAITINPGSVVEVTTGGWTLTLDGSQNLPNNGTLKAIDGSLIVDEAVTGTGTAFIGNGGTITFNSNFQQAVTLSGLGNTLGLSQLYNGTISGFGAADDIDFTSIAYKSSYEVFWAQRSGQGTITIVDSANNDAVVDSVTLGGTYSANSFRLAEDSQGNTEIIGTPPAPQDFNANGTSDILFQNSSNGEAYIWLMNGTTVTSSGFAGNNTNPGWEVISGDGDFNGDGKADILWQNTSAGQIYEYQMNGTSVLAANFIVGNTTWQAVATGDFNGDGHSDILFQNGSNGQVYEWEMNGFSVIGSGFVGNNTDPSWHVVANGDFNGDGKSDILFQNSNSGEIYEWEMDGTSVVASGYVGSNTNPAMQVVGTGDFNGDGKSDILFQNVTTGQVYEWEMNGTSVIGSGLVGNNNNPAWHVVDTGDYSGNGQSDILFQNTSSGQMYEWVMNGTTLVTGSIIGNNTDPTWHAIGKT